MGAVQGMIWASCTGNSPGTDVHDSRLRNGRQAVAMTVPFQSCHSMASQPGIPKWSGTIARMLWIQTPAWSGVLRWGVATAAMAVTVRAGQIGSPWASQPQWGSPTATCSRWCTCTPRRPCPDARAIAAAPSSTLPCASAIASGRCLALRLWLACKLDRCLSMWVGMYAGCQPQRLYLYNA